LAQVFNRNFSLLIEKIILNIFEFLTLATIRDTLLPKLISGEIRVREAEKSLDAVA
jgi:type I restriction enzyme S subunit